MHTDHAEETARYTIADTALGAIGLAWCERGIRRLALPQRDRNRLEHRISSLSGSAEHAEPPRSIAGVIDLISRYATGEAVDFNDVALDLRGIDSFCLDIYAAARRLAHGEVVTYGTLSDRAGHPGKARETGEALGRNPIPLIIPCHRILAAGGKIGGFSAPGGTATKRKLLELEGVQFGPPPPAQQSFGF